MIHIRNAYEKYNHLDKLFSDKQWLDIDANDDGHSIRRALFDMWEAIKQEVEAK